MESTVFGFDEASKDGSISFTHMNITIGLSCVNQVKTLVQSLHLKTNLAPLWLARQERLAVSLMTTTSV